MPKQPSEDLTNWLTREQAAKTLKVAEQSVVRYSTQGRLARRSIPVKGRRPIAVYNPDDVDKLRAELYATGAAAPEQAPDPMWITKEQAADALRVSEKSVERYTAAKRIQRKYVPKEGQRPAPLYNAADVQRLFQELYGVQPFIVPPPAEPARPPITRAKASAERARQSTAIAAVAGGTPLAVLGQVLAQGLSQAAGTPVDARIWIPLGAAAKVSGLPRWYLEIAIAEGRLPAHNITRQVGGKRRFRVRKADLESLKPARVSDR